MFSSANGFATGKPRTKWVPWSIRWGRVLPGRWPTTSLRSSARDPRVRCDTCGVLGMPIPLAFWTRPLSSDPDLDLAGFGSTSQAFRKPAEEVFPLNRTFQKAGTPTHEKMEDIEGGFPLADWPSYTGFPLTSALRSFTLSHHLYHLQWIKKCRSHRAIQQLSTRKLRVLLLRR